MKSSLNDTTMSAVPMNMSKPNKTRVEKLPPTPPRSVSFNLSDIVLNIPKETDDDFIVSPTDSIDISVRDLSEEIFVALVNRDTEMRELVERNKEFFDTIKQSIFEDEERWQEFLKVLYSKREEKPDSKWMDSISKLLLDNPPFLVNFKQIIGYYENYDNDMDLQEDCEDYTCSMNESIYIDITPIRDYPNVLKNLEKSYPQFFINAKNELGKLGKRKCSSTLGRNHLSNDNPLLHPNVDDLQPEDSDSSETLYDEFKRILITPRDVMNDVEWETAINECLDSWPNLLDQLEEIIVYEIRENREGHNFIEE